MARSRWIMPRADAACGKVFHPDRRTAEGHRIALELWNQATGHTREGRRLAVYRCGRCGGFHIATRKVEPRPARVHASTRPYETEQDWSNPAVEAVEMDFEPEFDLEAVSEAWRPVDD
jgi:hypothetical protein